MSAPAGAANPGGVWEAEPRPERAGFALARTCPVRRFVTVLCLVGCAAEAPAQEACAYGEIYDAMRVPLARTDFLVVVDPRIAPDVADDVAALVAAELVEIGEDTRVAVVDAARSGRRGQLARCGGAPLLEWEAEAEVGTLQRELACRIASLRGDTWDPGAALIDAMHAEGLPRVESTLRVLLVTNGDAPDTPWLATALSDRAVAVSVIAGYTLDEPLEPLGCDGASPPERLERAVQDASTVRRASICGAQWERSIARHPFRTSLATPFGCLARAPLVVDRAGPRCELVEELHPEAPLDCDALPGRGARDSEPRVCRWTAGASGWWVDDDVSLCGRDSEARLHTAHPFEQGSTVRLWCQTTLTRPARCGTAP